MSDSKSCRDFVAPHIAVLPKSGIRYFFDLVNTMSDVISLGIGEPDFVSPWSVCEGAMYSLERGRTSYTSNLGLLSLRRAICDYLDEEFGVRYVPENECLVTVGVSEAFDLAIRAITSPGDEIIYHEPCYVSYGTEIRMSHGVPVPVCTYEKNLFALDPADLEKAVTPRTRAIILNFPCNPTGAVLTDEQMRALASKGGVAQTTLYPGFLKKEGEASIMDAIAHLEHAIKIMGIDHVGLGTDFDGDGGVIGLADSSELINFTRQLLARRYSERDIQKIWGGNFLRVMSVVQKVNS